MGLVLEYVSSREHSILQGLEKLGVSAASAPSANTDISAVFVTGEFAARSDENAAIVREVCAGFKTLEAPVVFDPDLSSVGADKYALINEIAALSGIFLPSAEDAKALCGIDDPEEAVRHYLALGAEKIVVKLDKKGAYYHSAKESGYTPTFRADKVVDTHGAGKAFAAGLISGAVDELPLGEAVIRANACGCISIQRRGEYFPDSAELREYMLSHRFAVDGCKEY
ncbi:MAG: bifunctional hydroxymethylpyrimidine kinase/phosphomethylpyrimidine kinase [Oscillospiraceae bacterium]|nr:bifunctional hydroxymethylpyrimidine kinase/phosphomethylpyrimidine kinase [Oscillospiraceae bacterium]